MHISLDVTYMYINFGGCDFSGFGDIATKTTNLPLFRNMGYTSKNSIA